jgi:hypothetical protein
VAFSLANPVRRLLCVMSAAPLLHAPAQGMQGRLQITWNGTELEDPSVLDVSLTNRGRRDISRDDFDQPLEFRVQAQILAVLATTTKPDKTTFSAISFEDDVLKVGPGLIRRHQPQSFRRLEVRLLIVLASVFWPHVRLPSWSGVRAVPGVPGCAPAPTAPGLPPSCCLGRSVLVRRVRAGRRAAASR